MTVRVEAVVVARVEVPTTVSVPCEVRLLVKIPSVARRSAVKKEPVEVALVKDAATALKKVAKRLVLVLLVVEPLVEVKLVVVAFSAKRKVEDARVAAKLFVAVAFKDVTPPVKVPVLE